VVKEPANVSFEKFVTKQKKEVVGIDETMVSPTPRRKLEIVDSCAVNDGVGTPHFNS
jgi:hypothetical protein